MATMDMIKHSGGDRDGNPFATNAVTHQTLRDNSRACLLHYRERLQLMLAKLSIAAHAVNIPETFHAALDRELQASGTAEAIQQRNPGEAFRQYAACMLRKLDRTLAAVDGQARALPTEGYANADLLISDLRIMEAGLRDVGAEPLARVFVTPFRRAVEIFRFRTASLDLRQNTTVTTHTLQALWSPFGVEKLAGRFELLSPQLERRLPTIDQLSHQQVNLIRRFRSAKEDSTDHRDLAPLLHSINCIAAGFGWTG